MNKWSTSLPSIISLCSDVQFQFDPMFMQQSRISRDTSTSSSNKNLHDGGGSMSDLSILIQAEQSFRNYDEYSNNYSPLPKPSSSLFNTSVEHETIIQADLSSHNHFVPDDELLQSLVAYADSFYVDPADYKSQNAKQQFVAPTSVPTMRTIPRRRTQSSAVHIKPMVESDPLTRHKSCDDLSIACTMSSTSQPTTVMQREQHLVKKHYTKFVPSESHPQFFFATKTDEDNHNENENENDNNDINNTVERIHQKKLIDDVITATTITDGSKFEWGYSSDTMNEFNKQSTELCHNYEATTNIGEINMNYLRDLELSSSMAASMDFSQEISTPIPPPPVIIRRKSKDFIFKQQVDIQLLRPPTPPPPAPIIIREVRRKPSQIHKPITIHQKLENTGQIHISKTPSPIIIRERPPLPPRREYSSKPTILYRHLPTPPPSPPTVIVERLRAQASNVIQKPPSILVEKWLPYPPEQQPKIIYEKASPLPMRHKYLTNEQAKNIIVEYDDVNVIINKDVKQRQEIKRVRPDQYVQQFGNSLYSNETLNQLLTDFTCASNSAEEKIVNTGPFIRNKLNVACINHTDIAQIITTNKYIPSHFIIRTSTDNNKIYAITKAK
ncbi:unnamed protein product [Rotaria magnacalcarata]